VWGGGGGIAWVAVIAATQNPREGLYGGGGTQCVGHAVILLFSLFFIFFFKIADCLSSSLLTLWPGFGH
jgi:hypothetical protein